MDKEKQNIVIPLWRADQLVYLQDKDKPSNCFIIRSLSFFEGASSAKWWTEENYLLTTTNFGPFLKFSFRTQFISFKYCRNKFSATFEAFFGINVFLVFYKLWKKEPFFDRIDGDCAWEVSHLKAVFCSLMLCWVLDHYKNSIEWLIGLLNFPTQIRGHGS